MARLRYPGELVPPIEGPERGVEGGHAAAAKVVHGPAARTSRTFRRSGARTGRLRSRHQGERDDSVQISRSETGSCAASPWRAEVSAWVSCRWSGGSGVKVPLSLLPSLGQRASHRRDSKRETPATGCSTSSRQTSGPDPWGTKHESLAVPGHTAIRGPQDSAAAIHPCGTGRDELADCLTSA